MASSEVFNLSWQTYTVHLRSMLDDMMKTKALSDVTLVSDDKKQIQAHKFVLSASSKVFKDMIDCLPPNSMIYLRGVKFKELQGLLEFLYSGQVSIDQNNLKEFLNVASDLEIQGLIKQTEAWKEDEKTADDGQYGSLEDFEGILDTEGNRNHENESNIEPCEEYQDQQTNAEELNTEGEVNAAMMDVKTEEEDKLSDETGKFASSERIPNWIEGKINKLGKPSRILEKDGFTYLFNKSLYKDRLNRVYFRCTRLDKKSNCRATAIVDLEKDLILEISYDEDHTHPPDTTSHIVKKIEEAAFKRGLEDIDLKATELYRDLQENVINSEAGEKGLTYLKSLKSFRCCLDSRRIKSGLKIKQNRKYMLQVRRKFY